MWANRDEFQFAWRKLSGDFILQARIAFVGAGVDPHRKAGLIIRSTMEADSPYADAVIHGDGLTSLQFRKTKGAVTEQIESPVKGADVVQIERQRLDLRHVGREVRPAVHDVTGRRSGTRRRCVRRAGAVLAQSCRRRARDLLAMSASSARRRTISGRIATTSAACSRCSTCTTGQRQALWTSQQPFEAPNWTRDGALIVNTSGTDADWRGGCAASISRRVSRR